MRRSEGGEGVERDEGDTYKLLDTIYDIDREVLIMGRNRGFSRIDTVPKKRAREAVDDIINNARSSEDICVDLHIWLD